MVQGTTRKLFLFFCCTYYSSILYFSVSSIQAKGIASAQLKLHNVSTSGAAAAGNLVATYNFGTEGLEVYVPGSGILFDEGIVYNLTGASGSATVTITGG